MRRKEREVSSFDEIVAILGRCDTIRLGIRGERFPYVVPVSFGMAVENGQITLYFHCAQQGLKIDLLKEHPEICVEADRFFKIEKTEIGITTRYESVIGFGKCEFLTEKEDILKGLRTLVGRYGYDDYPLDRCRGLKHLSLWKITLESVTGKQNLPAEFSTSQ